MSKSLKIAINLDLLFDYNSLLFSLIRSYFLISNVSIAPQTKLAVEMQNPSKAFDEVCKIIDYSPTAIFKNEFLVSFNYYLKTIKPQISIVPFLNFIKMYSSEIYLTTYLEPEHMETIMKIHKLDFPIVFFKENAHIEEFVKNQISSNESDFIFFDGNIEILDYLSLKFPNFLYVLIKNSNYKCKNSFESITNPLIKPFLGFEDIDFKALSTYFPENLEKYPKEFILDFSKKPLSEEIIYWKSFLYLEKPLVIESFIIRGFGRGGKQLGMPTANLEITQEINEQLKPIIPGIYFGWAQFEKEKNEEFNETVKYGQKYQCVISTGFNPFYENKEKTFEVHIMDRFDKDYYGAFMKVEVLGFIRCESDLKYFDHLIKMIHNDVHIAQEFLKEKS